MIQGKCSILLVACSLFVVSPGWRPKCFGLAGLETPVDLKLKLIPMLQHMHHDASLASSSRELLQQLVNSYPSTPMVIVTLHTFTQLAASSLIDIPKQVWQKRARHQDLVLCVYHVHCVWQLKGVEAKTSWTYYSKIHKSTASTCHCLPVWGFNLLWLTRPLIQGWKILDHSSMVSCFRNPSITGLNLQPLNSHTWFWHIWLVRWLKMLQITFSPRGKKLYFFQKFLILWSAW